MSGPGTAGPRRVPGAGVGTGLRGETRGVEGPRGERGGVGGWDTPRSIGEGVDLETGEALEEGGGIEDTAGPRDKEALGGNRMTGMSVAGPGGRRAPRGGSAAPGWLWQGMGEPEALPGTHNPLLAGSASTPSCPRTWWARTRPEHTAWSPYL